MPPRLIFITILLSVSMTHSNSHAGYAVSGNLLHDSRVLIADTDGDKGEFIKSISRLDLKGRRLDEDGISLFGEIWMTYDHLDSFEDQIRGAKSVNSSRPDYDQFDLREAYASASLGPTDFKAGEMILNWGRTDEISPVDVINPEDFSEFYSIDKEERKIPALLFNALLHMGNFTLEAVWLPFFEPSVVPSEGMWAQRWLTKYKDILPPGQYDSLDYGEGKHSISRSETGVRFSGTLESFDMGLVYFYGSNDLPTIKVEGNDQGQVMSSIQYCRFHGIGFDFAYYFSGYGLRGEVFYRDEVSFLFRTMIGGSNNYEAPDLQSVLGIDKTFRENLYVNAQLMHHRIMEYRDESMADEDTFMAMLAMEYRLMDSDLKLALKAFYGFNEKDWMINPYVEYSITDNLKVRPGAYLYAGPEDSDMGQFDNNDMMYLRISYAF